MTSFLFVYGTLMQRERNEFTRVIKKSTRYIGKGFVYAKKYDLGDFPGIKIDLSKKHKTQGELYEITANQEELFLILDEYEGYNENNIETSLFIRKEIEVITEHKTFVAWVYEYNQFGNS